MTSADRPDDPTLRLDPTLGAGTPGASPPGASPPGGPAARRDEPDHTRSGAPRRRPPRRTGRDLLIGASAAIFGFLLAFVLVALGTSDPAPDGELAAAQERIRTLEAEVGERDARVGDLEARLAEAEAAAGDRAADVEAQRRALDDRAASLDERARNLDAREAALEERERAVAERERRVAEAEGEPPTGDPAPPGVPSIDEEAARSIVERVLEQIREVFQRDS
jgi:septal ring factor EnvC (AmiA/AmiB activator)